jgi:hypothetical protein
MRVISSSVPFGSELYESPSIVREEKTERRQRLAEEAEKKKLEHERQEISTKG